MMRRLTRTLRRREAERRRVEAFLAAIRATEAPPLPVVERLPVVAVELVDTPRGPVWQLDAASRARFAQRTDTAEIPLPLLRLLVSPR